MRVRHTHGVDKPHAAAYHATTLISWQLGSSHSQHASRSARTSVCCFFATHSDTCVRVLHRPHVFLCLCVPAHDTGIVILGDDELQYRPTLSKNKRWEFKTWDSGVANLGQLARIGGVLWDEISAGVHFGGCAGGSTLAHHMHRAWPGCLVFTARKGCGHSIRDFKWALQHGELHRIWGPNMPTVATNSATSSAVHAIGVAAPEGSAGGEESGWRRAAVQWFFLSSPSRTRRQWRWGDAAIACLFFLAVTRESAGAVQRIHFVCMGSQKKQKDSHPTAERRARRDAHR